MDAAPKRKLSTLHTKVQSLLELICDLKAMEECVLEMKFDTKKAPLGQRSSTAPSIRLSLSDFSNMACFCREADPGADPCRLCSPEEHRGLFEDGERQQPEAAGSLQPVLHPHPA